MTDAAPKSEPAAAAMQGSAASDAALVRELALVLGETNLTEIEMRRGDLRIRVSRQTVAVAPAPVHHVAAAPLAAAPLAAPAKAAEPADDLAQHPGAVTSPSTARLRCSCQPSWPRAPSSRIFMRLWPGPGTADQSSGGSCHW